jgi:hypothetical protein
MSEAIASRNAAGGSSIWRALIVGVVLAIGFTFLAGTGHARAALGPLGFETFSFSATGEHGEAVTQAGSHPDKLETNLRLKTTVVEGEATPNGVVRDLLAELPAGLVGNPTATERCLQSLAERGECPADTQVGLVWADIGNHGATAPEEGPNAIYNVVPPRGVAARFVGEINGDVSAIIDAEVRTGGDYGITSGSHALTEEGKAWGARLVLWGVPGARSHESERFCLVTSANKHVGKQFCSQRPFGLSMKPFLSLPTRCTGESLQVGAEADFWAPAGPAVFANTWLPALTGCGNVRFAPSIKVVPDSAVSDAPTGLQVELTVPQDEEPEQLATADLKDASVTLPVGMTINPAEASGVTGCPLLSGPSAHPGVVGIDLENKEGADCPASSRIGKVELVTPLVDHSLTGSVYLAQQGNAGLGLGSNPFGSMLAMYIAVEDPLTGVIVKLAGQVRANPLTGQLTTTFDENPQLPFETLKLDFFGGQRAALATPSYCGLYTTTSELEPWSHPAPAGETGTQDAAPSGQFAITSLAGGGPCGTPPFAPALTSGTTDNQAGAFSSLVTLLKRGDGQQELKAVSLTLPKGLSGMIAKVPLCGEAAADAGACSADSQIGNVSVQAGVGNKPLTLPQPGRAEDPVFLTGPFEGAPFGLAIVVHPEAGPFDLAEGAGTPRERPIVVRAKIEVNPRTAQVTVATPASGPYAMPTILQGIPVDVQAVVVNIDRQDFLFNATSCEPMAVAGTIGSAEGATAQVSSRYQASGCAKLAFQPHFAASTQARNSRRNGAALSVHVTFPASGQANIAKVKVQLPKVLPARSETLKLACRETQFAENPASCPAASRIGSATATTPILRSPLTGPVYFVSHAGLSFPELVAVLQGEGVTVDLAGETYISPKGITTSTFATVPDDPIRSFEMVLPEGPYSALTAQGTDLCEQKLLMPTQITAQNGALINRTTRITVDGCPSAIKLARRKTRGRTLVLGIYVPREGKVVASAPGFRTEMKNVKGRGVITLVLAVRHKNKACQNRARVHVTFTPTHGQVQKRTFTAAYPRAGRNARQCGRGR